MDKLCKTAAGLDTFLKASFWGIAITIMVPVVVMPIAALTGGFEDSFLGLLAGYGITVERGEAGLPVSYRSILAVLSVLSAAISCIILYGIYLAREILRPMKEGRPFDTAVSRSFRRLGFVALAAGGAEFVVTAVMQHIVPNALRTPPVRA